MKGLDSLSKALEEAGRSAESVLKDMEASGLGRMLREWRADAIAEDPGLMAAVRFAQELDPDIGWIEVAAEREEKREQARLDRKANPSLTAYLGGLG